jgi:GT2 family glycosyltransferase
MFLSVIIPTYNRYDLLSNCLENLSPDIQTLDACLYEVIVTDDSKYSTHLENIKNKFPWVNFIEGPQKGPASNRNNGAKLAKGDWFIFIDDDCIPDPDILRSYLAEINKGFYKGIEGYIYADRIQERFDEQSPLNLLGGCFWSCNIAVEREVYEKLGGFDEGFPFAALEDTDFYERLKKVAPTTFLEKAKVMHPWRRVGGWNAYKKWLKSNEYAIKKAKIPKNFKYRLKRINLFIGLFLEYSKSLYVYSFKGINFYLELNWFNFLMIFK